MKHCAKSAFTLIELLVVISIVFVLASILSVGYQAAQSSAHKVQCLSHIRSIGQVSILYANDDKALRFPYTTTFSQSNLYRLLYDPVNFADDDVLVCPIPKGRLASAGTLPGFVVGTGVINNPGTVSYHFVQGRIAADTVEAQTMTYPSSNILLIEKTDAAVGSGDFHGERGIPVFRINGKVELINPDKAPGHYYANGTTVMTLANVRTDMSSAS